MFRFRQLRVQKETEEAEHRKQEVILQREQEMQTFIQEKEQEILQLQVRCRFQKSTYSLLILIGSDRNLFEDCICSLNLRFREIFVLENNVLAT